MSEGDIKRTNQIAHVRPGQRPSASMFNQLIDSANNDSAAERTLNSPNSPRNNGLVLLKGWNMTDARFELFDVIILRSILEEPDLAYLDRQVVFQIDKIGEGDEAASFGVCQQPIEAGQLGHVAIAGYTIAKISGTSYQDFPTAGIPEEESDSFLLDAGSIRVLWNNGSLGFVCLGLGSDPSEYLIARWSAYEGR